MKRRQLLQTLSETRLFKNTRKLWEQNQQNWYLPLSKFDKLLLGIYLIITDYSNGEFRHTFEDQQKAYDAEINYKFSLPGIPENKVTDALISKPFWFGKPAKSYLTDFIDLVGAFERTGIHPPQKLLELGCGTGWMAEFLALMDFEVVATSISPYEIMDAQKRVKSLEAKQVNAKLKFMTAAMESVDQVVQDHLPFDGVYVFEALHHAFNWQQAIKSSFVCLKPGGWLIIANEPNAIHTFVSYRVAKLSNTHEIGFAKRELITQLKYTGFRKIKVIKNSFNFFVLPHWIICQK
jgi:2-polyprenyl-3-methyl-5-hydroxy-6-metoxy-1,4-benzoquinol methylase